MPALRGWWRLRVSTMTLKQRDWWLEHRDALKKKRTKNYTLCIEWALEFRCDECVVVCCVLSVCVLGHTYAHFFFVHHSGILCAVCFHLLSAILFVSLVRFLVSLIASRYIPCLCKTAHAHTHVHTFGIKAYMYTYEIRVINKRSKIHIPKKMYGGDSGNSSSGNGGGGADIGSNSNSQTNTIFFLSTLFP